MAEKIEEERKEFGLRIKRLRCGRLIPIGTMAESMQVPRSTYINWESGRAWPSIIKIRDLAAYFGVSVDTLLNAKADAAVDELMEKIVSLPQEKREAVIHVIEAMMT